VKPRPEGGSPRSFEVRERLRVRFSFARRGRERLGGSVFPRPSGIGTSETFRNSRPSGIGTLGTFKKLSSERNRNLRDVPFCLARAKTNPRHLPLAYGTNENGPPKRSISPGVSENAPPRPLSRPIDWNRQVRHQRLRADPPRMRGVEAAGPAGRDARRRPGGADVAGRGCDGARSERRAVGGSDEAKRPSLPQCLERAHPPPPPGPLGS